jgi:hypothetical protein
MAYFDDVQIGESVFGLVFGVGKVVDILEDHFYKFLVEFHNGYTIWYDRNGIPQWGNFQEQTVFYKDYILDSDILEEYDFKPAIEDLTPEDIIRYREKDKLEVKCPSGLWTDYKKCPIEYLVHLYETQSFNKFRKKLKK